MKTKHKAAALAVALTAGALVTFSALRAEEVTAPTAAEIAPPIAPAAPVAPVAPTAPVGLAMDGGIERMMAPRVLGNPDAPVKIEEFASLTCPHCAHFSNEVLPQLKAQYIDSGKVRLVYNDFPLNADAVTAAMLARCAPEGQYFNLIESFFMTQADWLGKENMTDLLKSATAMAGLPNDKADACLANDGLRNAILQARMTAEQAKDIRSTPTFIINDDAANKIAGPETLEQLKGPIDKALAAAGVQ